MFSFPSHLYLIPLCSLLPVIMACEPAHQRGGAPDSGAATVDATPEIEADASAPSLVPSNASVFGELLETGANIAAANATFDTDSECVEISLLGACTVAVPDVGPEFCVCRADSYAIGDVDVVGSRGLALLANQRIDVTGSFDLVRSGTTAPGQTASYETPAPTSVGGRGGSFGSVGGSGGGEVYGNDSLVPLLGGMNGQAGCSVGPGIGGGAIQLSAGETVVVSEVGRVSANGSGGSGGFSSGVCLGGAGGGSGGGVLIEAPVVEILGALGANGGGGGGGGSNRHGGGGLGGSGQIDVGGIGGQGEDDHGCPLNGFTSGGDGGRGAFEGQAARSGQSGDSVGGCLNGTERTGAGGGGGSVGRIRLNTEGGCQCSGRISPAPTFGLVVIE